MKIIVLMKQVANKDAVLRIAGDEKWINEADIAQQTNESDGYALEEALRMKEAKGEGEVVVCSLGPQSAKTVIKDALARGADRAIHVVVEESKTLSPYQIANAIADAIRDENADLVFTGLQSDDASYGQTGVILAELLGIPHATIVIEVDRASLNGSLRRQTRARKRLVSMVYIPAAGSVDDSVRHLADSLRFAERHYGGEEKRDQAMLRLPSTALPQPRRSKRFICR